MAATLLLGVFGAKAQMPQVPAAPIDSAVRIGKLENGLTYYIRHNEMPKGQADFFIAQKVGSILEDENQRGLAHFLEHMCFNGTKNFPGNGLIDWLETQGVKFGYNLNAMTGIDETIYNISSVPVQRSGVIDSCLLILHDWANDLILDPEEIDKERGVIHQEWRRSNEGQMRILESLLPKIYPDNKYGVRLPIGTMEVVDNFPPQALRDYYETWYRPDLQGVIVVGDIDPDYVESQIKKIFADIEMPANPKERVYLEVEDTPGTIYAIGSDKEMKFPMMMFSIKQKENLIPRELRGTTAFFGVNYITSMINSMMNQRLSDFAKKPDCPYAQASFDLGEFLVSKTKDAVNLTVIAKGNDPREAFAAAYREVLRAVRGGFTMNEYDLAKKEYISSLEKAYDQRNGRENTSYAREYSRHFTDADPIPGIEFELNMARMLTQQIPLQVLNMTLPELFTDDNRVFIGLFPETDSFTVPTDQQMAEVISSVQAEELEPFKDEMKAEPLVGSLPAAQKATRSEDAQWGATRLTYPNGVTVIVKPTKFKEGEIVFDATAKGGLTSSNLDAASQIYLPYALARHGLGTYNSTDLERYLLGTQVSVNMGLDEYLRSLSGSSTTKDLKTLMELIYMNMTAFDITPEDFSSMQAQIEAILSNQESTPQYAFQSGWFKSLYKSPTKQMLSTEIVKKADREAIIATVHDMFSNPGSFLFSFVGDIDLETFIPLCDQYIGSIPASRIADVPLRLDPADEPEKGSATTIEKMKMATPQTWVAITMSGNINFTPENRLLASMSGQILSNRLLKKIREEMGAVYSISAGAQMSRLGTENVFLQIPFPMKPEMKDQVLAEIASMIEGMGKEVAESEFQPVKEFMAKQAVEGREKNEDWVNAIAGTYLNGIDCFNGLSETIARLTAADIVKFMKQLIDQNNYRVFVLEPEQ